MDCPLNIKNATSWACNDVLQLMYNCNLNFNFIFFPSLFYVAFDKFPICVKSFFVTHYAGGPGTFTFQRTGEPV